MAHISYSTLVRIICIITACLVYIASVKSDDGPPQDGSEYRDSQKDNVPNYVMDDAPFPNILASILEKQSIRYLYEINTNYQMPEKEVKSILVEEMYSFVHKVGRLKYYDGQMDRSFYWYDKTGERIWTSPYNCNMNNVALGSYEETGIFNDWFPGAEKMFSYSQRRGNATDSYYGIVGLMMNALLNAKFSYGLKRTQNSLLFSLRGIKKHARCWSVEVPIDENESHALRFLFELVDPVTVTDAKDTLPQLEYEKAYEIALISPLIKFSAQTIYKKKQNDENSLRTDKMVITVLRMDLDKVKPSDLRLPQGFGCRREETPDFQGFYPFKRGKDGIIDRMVYQMEATLRVKKDRVKNHNTVEGIFNPYVLRNEEFEDQDLEVIYTSMPFTLIDDSAWKMFAILYEPNIYNLHQSRLIAWDLDSRIKSDIDLDRQFCRQIAMTEEERAVLDFPDASRLILANDGNLIMAYYDDNPFHNKLYSNLINEADLNKTISDTISKRSIWSIYENNNSDKFGFGATGSDWSVLVYEGQPENFDMKDSTWKSFDPMAISLAKKYLYNRRSKKIKLLSYDVYFYKDKNRLEREGHLHINIRSIDHLDHWARPRNLIDLSSCYKDKPRRSAQLTIYFPLTHFEPFMNIVDKPHTMMRKSLVSYFRLTFKLPETRINFIDFEIEPDYLLAKVILLDKPSIEAYSKKIPSSLAVLSSFQEWSKKATFVTLANDLVQCASYCESYRCTHYLFCANNLNCMLFHMRLSDDDSMKPPAWFGSDVDLNTTSKRDPVTIANFGSYYGAGHICMANEVSPLAYDKNLGWSLEDILDKLDSIMKAEEFNKTSDEDGQDEEQPEELPKNIRETGIDNFWDHKGRYSKPTISMVVRTNEENKMTRMVAAEATRMAYKWDNPLLTIGRLGSSSHESAKYDVNLSMSVKFNVLSPERRFLTSRPSPDASDGVADGVTLVDGDLEDNGGITVIYHQEFDDCARMCLNDLNCMSFSYCPSDLECVLTSLSDPSEINLGTRSKVDVRCSISTRSYMDMFRRSETKIYTRLPDLGASISYRTYKVSNSQICATYCVAGTEVQALNLKGLAPLTQSETVKLDKSVPFKCLSFDYCIAANEFNCILYDKHFVGSSQVKDHIEDKKIDLPSKAANDQQSGQGSVIGIKPTGRNSRHAIQSSLCIHHSRVFLVDFNKIHKKRLPRSMVALRVTNDGLEGRGDSGLDDTIGDEQHQETMGQPTVERCSRLCEEDQNCGAFEFCLAIKRDSGENFASCSLGNNNTFELIGAKVSQKKRKGVKFDRGEGNKFGDPNEAKTTEPIKQKEALERLKASDFCSVYVYNDLAYVVASRRKNTQFLVDEIAEEEIKKWWVGVKSIFRLDLLMLVLAIAIGFVLGRYQDHGLQLRELYEGYKRSLAADSDNDNYLDAIIEGEFEPDRRSFTHSMDRDINEDGRRSSSLAGPSHQVGEDLTRVSTIQVASNLSGGSASDGYQGGLCGLDVERYSLEERRKSSITSLTNNITKPVRLGNESLGDVDENQL